MISLPPRQERLNVLITFYATVLSYVAAPSILGYGIQPSSCILVSITILFLLGFFKIQVRLLEVSCAMIGVLTTLFLLSTNLSLAARVTRK